MIYNGCLNLPNLTNFWSPKSPTVYGLLRIEIKNTYAVNLIVCRCIAVTTTLSDEALESAGPNFIRDDIGSISLDEILNGDSIGYSM